MSQLKIAAALLKTLKAINPPLPTVEENGAENQPQDGSPWQRVEFLWNEPEDPARASPLYRERGIFQVTLVYPKGQGSGGATARAELIRAAFPKGDLPLSSPGVITTIERTPELGPSFTNADGYNKPVRVRFFANLGA